MKSILALILIIIFFIIIHVVVWGVKGSEWFLLIFLIIIWCGIINNRNREKNKKDERVIVEGNYCRDIPCDGDVFRIYYIACLYGIIENKEGIINITNGVKLSIDLCSEGKVRGVVSKKEGNRVLVVIAPALERQSEERSFGSSIGIFGH
jgi:hypothetical protein